MTNRNGISEELRRRAPRDVARPERDTAQVLPVYFSASFPTQFDGRLHVRIAVHSDVVRTISNTTLPVEVPHA
jgi:hypothetical protein